MELATIFLIWLFVTIIDSLSKRKKGRVPPKESSADDSQDFDIPKIANDPNFPGEEVPIFIESPRQAEIRPARPKNPPTRKISAQEVHDSNSADELDLNLTPSTVMNAFVLSEILGKPKALRRR